MKIINVPRQSGKSKWLLKHAYENNYAIIVSTLAKKNKLKEEALYNKFYGVKIFTTREFLHGVNGAKFGRDDKVCIDDMEEVLADLIGFEIDTVTCTIPFSEEFLNEKGQKSE